MPTARFPGQACCMCGGEFVPRETEIEAHPNMQGPRGGKKYMHSNPQECGARANPFAAQNAGRRKKRGRQYPSPDFAPAAGVMAPYHPADLVGLSISQLRGLAAEGVVIAQQELSRRERGSSGEKTNTPAWVREFREKRGKKAVANPYRSTLPAHLRIFEF